MFAGRSSASKTHVLFTLLCCLYLIVLDIDHVASMSLDKLVVERNEIGQDLMQSVENSAKTQSSDEYAMLPGSQEEFERNTIEDNGGMAAEEDAFDMLMMETNEAPMIQVVQLPEGLSKEAETQNVETAESLVANEDKLVTSTPIALVLADLAQQQTGAEDEQAVEVEKTAAELKQDAAQVVNNVHEVVTKEQEAQTTSNEEDSESESVAEMILEAVETMQQALKSSNKLNADIAVQEEELEKEAENELLGNAIQEEFAEVVEAQSNAYKEPPTEQLENQVVADVVEDLETTIDDIPSEEYVDAEAGGAMNAVIEALVDESVEDQEVAESEHDSVAEAVVENIVPGNLVSNKLFIEEPTHNTVHENVKPLEDTQKTKVEHSEVEPEEAEALIVHDEEIDAEEAGEETTESIVKNEDEEVKKVSLENQKKTTQAPKETQAVAGKIEQAQVQVSGESEVNQGMTQTQVENLVVLEDNSEQAQGSEESQLSAVENEAQVQKENQKLPEKQEQAEAQQETQALEEKQEQAQIQEETEAAEEKVEQAEVQAETQAAEENQEQAQVQDDTQAVEETQDSEDTAIVEEKLEQAENQQATQVQEEIQGTEENQNQIQVQESHEALEKLEQAELQAENQSVDGNQVQEHAQEESQSQEEQVEVQEEIQAVPETVPEQVQNQAQTIKDSQEEQTEAQQGKLEIPEVQAEQAQAAQEEIQEQAIPQEIKPENAEIQSEDIKEDTKEQEELNNEEQSVKEENELHINLDELYINEKEPEEEPQKAEEQSELVKKEENKEKQEEDEEKQQEQLNVEQEEEEVMHVKEENEEKQKLEEDVPKVEQQDEEEEIQEINEPTTAVENEEEQNINEPTIELEKVEELEHNGEKQIEEVEKLDESAEEAQQNVEQTIEEQNEQKEEKKEAQQETEQTAEEHREVTHNEAEQTAEAQPEKHEEQEEPQEETEQTIEEHNENHKVEKEAEKESIQEEDQKPEQIISAKPNEDNLDQEEIQTVQADTIEELPQTIVQNGDESTLMEQNLEEQEISQESAVNQVEEVVLPLSDSVIVPQDVVAVLQEVNENEEASNAEIFNVEAEPTQEIAIEQDEVASEAIVAQTTGEQAQKVQEQQPVKLEEEVLHETVAEIEKETEAKPIEAAEIAESAQIDVQSVSNTIAPEQSEDVEQVDEDKAQNVEEPQQIDNQSSMLTTIVQVPAIQQTQQTAVQPIQAVAVEEVGTKVETAAEEPQPMTISSTNNTLTGPLNVIDSVLNYVNASFISNNNNNNNKKKQPVNDEEFNSQLRRYDGAQVWRIVVQNDRDKKLVDELQTKYDAQLWKEVKAEVDYLLKPQVLADAEKHIRRANLSRIVLIDNLQKVIEVENPPAEEIAQLQNRKGHRMTWQAYHRLQDIHGFFDYLAKTYPDICSVETIGYSIEKRALKILKISNGNAANPGIWMDGGMHAREWISPASVTFIANQLVEGWDDLPAYMRNVNWYIHAVANPDGYEYSHTTDRLWRKNMRSHGRQCPGVDLNRNFGYKWGGKGTSANPCSMTYRGSKAFSEPETFYISKFISNFPRETFQAYLSFHSYGQYILYPWGYDYLHSTDRAELDLVARQAGTTITRGSGVKYTVGSSATTLYPAAGGSDDWAKGIAGIKYAYTIEMGDTGRYGFVLPASMIENNGKDGFTFVETVARAVTHQDQDIRRRALYKRYSLKSF